MALATSPLTPQLDDPTEAVDLPEGPKGRRRGRRALAVVAGATVIVLGGAGVAVAHADKQVVLDVDGSSTHLSTFAGSVAGLLAQRGVRVGAADSVSGALADGATIVVRHAKDVSLVAVDGQVSTVTTTALTAADALETLGHGSDGIALAVSRANQAGAPVLPLTLADAPATAAVAVDGRTVPLTDPSVSVAEALSQAGVSLGGLDRVSVTPVTGGVQLVVTRVVNQLVTTTAAIPHTSSTVDDPTAYVGTKKVTTAGADGSHTVFEQVVTTDGVETSRTVLMDQVTAPAVNEVVSVGTKAKPVAKAASSSSASSASAASSDDDSASAATPSGDSASLNWAALAACESGGNPQSVSASGRYYGLYQFSPATWASVGGSGLPSDASASEQTARAQMLYDRSGAGQWPVCGKRLFS